MERHRAEAVPRDKLKLTYVLGDGNKTIPLPPPPTWCPKPIRPTKYKLRLFSDGKKFFPRLFHRSKNCSSLSKRKHQEIEFSNFTHEWFSCFSIHRCRYNRNPNGCHQAGESPNEYRPDFAIIPVID